jgi:hypothetical protein
VFVNSTKIIAITLQTQQNYVLCSLFPVIPRLQNFLLENAGCSFMGRLSKKKRSMKAEQTECSETSAEKMQTPGNNPKGGIKHSQHGE